MSVRPLSPEDRRELGRLTKILTQKVVQVVVQSRLGEKAHTRSKSPVQGSDWFNLGIEDINEILMETKKGLAGHLPEKGKPLVVEILLRTPANDTLVLELWTLMVVDACDTSPARINPTIYNRMTVLLKSLLSVTRITPAYKLAFRQGPESFVICYRIYLGDPDFEILGDKYIHARLGQVTTPESTLLLSVAYRTQITIAPPSRSPAHDPIMLKSDHFKPEISPRHCRRGDRATDSSEATQTSDESQDAGRLFTTSPPDHPSTPRSRTSSESSSRGHTQPPERKVSVAFADAKPPKPDDFFMPDIPFSNLLTSTVEVTAAAAATTTTTTTTKGEKEPAAAGGAGAGGGASGGGGGGGGQMQDKASVGGVAAAVEAAAAPTTGAAAAVAAPGATERLAAMTGSDTSHKSNASAQLKEEADFVMVDLKTPFAGVSEAGSDLGTFYRECQSAPQLRMFADTPEDEISDLAEQLLTFEGYVDDYNELVRSLHSEDSPSTSQ